MVETVAVLMAPTLGLAAPTALPSARTDRGPAGAAGSETGAGRWRLSSMDASPPPPNASGTILSVWAHPDDETYLAGGLMAAARDRGQRVVCASASAGEHGTDDPATWPPDRLGALRRWEAAAAMAVLGVTEHHIGGFPDGALADHAAAGVNWVGRLLDVVRPDTIVTFGADGITFHPDHVAVHHWVTQAWCDRGRPGRLLYAAPTVAHLDRFGARYEEWGIY